MKVASARSGLIAPIGTALTGRNYPLSGAHRCSVCVCAPNLANDDEYGRLIASLLVAIPTID